MSNGRFSRAGMSGDNPVALQSQVPISLYMLWNYHVQKTSYGWDGLT